MSTLLCAVNAVSVLVKPRRGWRVLQIVQGCSPVPRDASQGKTSRPWTRRGRGCASETTESLTQRRGRTTRDAHEEEH